MDFMMLLISVWRWWYLGPELDHVIYVLRYLIELMISAFLALDHDHEPVHAISASEYLFGHWFYASGGLDP
jgi:hypothetical protein